MSRPTYASPHHVVVIGAGFGGLETVRHLAGSTVRVTLIDSRNHHLFQPLLYQVATASLAPSEIAWPIRHLLRRRRDVTTWLAAVEAIDKDPRRVRLDDGSLVDFDTLVLATGARHAYFGHDDWESFAPGLKTLCQWRAESPQKWRRKIPQFGGRGSAVGLNGASIVGRPSATF